MGILFTLLGFVIRTHINSSYVLLKFFNTQILLYFLYYWLCNKLGLTISIHSFIKNTFFLKYFDLFILMFLYYNTSYLNFIIFCLLSQLLYNLISIFLFKLLCIAMFYIYMKKVGFRSFVNLILHKFIYKMIILFIFLNINNITFYKLTNKITLYHTISFNNLKILTQLTSHYNLNLLKKEFFFFKFFNINYLNFG